MKRQSGTPYLQRLRELDECELDEVLDTRESADEIALISGRMPTRATIRNWLMASGRAWRLGRRLLWRRRDLLEYLDSTSREVSVR